MSVIGQTHSFSDVIPDFGWDSGLGGFTYVVGDPTPTTYPPSVPAYAGGTTYTPGDDVSSAGSEYICILTTTGHTPPNATYWEPIPNRFTNYQTPLNTPVTFDAIDSMALGLPTVYTPSGISISRYEWDFGNGQFGFGATAITTYTYQQGPPDIQAKLTVTDSIGRRYSVAHRLLLVQGTTLYAMGHIR